MGKMTDTEILCAAIEAFLVQHFNTIELAGSIKARREEGINYFGIDLKNFDWDKNVDALNAELIRYLKDWVGVNGRSLENWLLLANITVEYKLRSEDETKQNIAKSIRLFYPPSHYYVTNRQKQKEVRPNLYRNA